MAYLIPYILLVMELDPDSECPDSLVYCAFLYASSPPILHFPSISAKQKIFDPWIILKLEQTEPWFVCYPIPFPSSF